MKDSEVHSAVVRWVRKIIGGTVIKADQDGPRPTLPYTIVRLVQQRALREFPQFEEFDPPLTLASSTTVLASEDDLNASLLTDDSALGDVTAYPIIETEWHFSVNAYGRPPIDHKTKLPVSPKPAFPTDILRPLRAAAELAQMNEPLMPGMTVHEVSDVRNLPEVINERIEPRAQIDIYLRGIVRDGFVIDTINRWSFEFERS